MSILPTKDIVSWFKNHTVAYHEIIKAKIGKIEYLRYEQPTSNNCMINYLLFDGNLCVTGDLGEAIYNWYGQVNDLEWIAELSVDYFHRKCRSSENGLSTRNYEWDQDLAEKKIFEHFKDTRNCLGFKKFKEEMIDTTCEFALNAWCHENNPSEIFDDQDWWEWLPRCGHITPIRTRAHLIALKLIFGKELKYCGDER